MTVLDPLHRAGQLEAGQHGGQLLRAGVHLESERSPDVRHDDPHPGVVQSQQAGEQAARTVGPLRGDPDRELLAVAVPSSQNAPCFHRDRGIPVLAERLRHHQLRRFQHRLQLRIVEGRHGRQHVRVPLRMHEPRPVGEGLLKVDEWLFGLDVDNHRFDPVLGKVPRVRHNHDDGLTHAADISIGQDPPRPIGVVLVVDEVVVHERGQVAGGVHGANPRNGRRFLHVDRNDPTTSRVAPYEGGMKGSRQGDVVDKQPMAGQETCVFLAGHPLPHEAGPATHHLGHLRLPCRCRCTGRWPMTRTRYVTRPAAGHTTARRPGGRSGSPGKMMSFSITCSLPPGRSFALCIAVSRI